MCVYACVHMFKLLLLLLLPPNVYKTKTLFSLPYDNSSFTSIDVLICIQYFMVLWKSGKLKIIIFAIT